jgi:hypothetical protein
MSYSDEVLLHARDFLMWNAGKHGHGRAKANKDWESYGRRKVPERLRADVHECWLGSIEAEHRKELEIQMSLERESEDQLGIDFSSATADEKAKLAAQRSDTIRRAFASCSEYRRNPTRFGDPVGSKLASMWFSNMAGPHRVKAFAFLLDRPNGAILEEIAAGIGVRENSISTQLTTMRDDLDLIEGPGPEIRNTSRDTPMGVWQVVPALRARYEAALTREGVDA